MSTIVACYMKRFTVIILSTSPYDFTVDISGIEAETRLSLIAINTPPSEFLSFCEQNSSQEILNM